MQITACSNPLCNKQFELAEFGHARPAETTMRVIRCPYCGNETIAESRGAFITRCLEDQSHLTLPIKKQ